MSFTSPNSAMPLGGRRAKDMKGSDWRGLVRGFLKFMKEEEKEPEHVEAEDSVLLALDWQGPGRTKDDDGHLFIPSSIVSAAQVNNYRGEEIPNSSRLGLDPKKLYALLRDPDELAKGAETLHGKPFVLVHRSQTAEDHNRQITIGSVMNPVWEDPNLKAEIMVWVKEGIDFIESGEKSSLSCGYRYEAVMQPGTYNGISFDGRMTAIEFNHLALVENPRVIGAVVGDEATTNQPSEQPIMNTAVSRRFAAIRAFVAPRLAKDQSIEGLEHILALDADPDMMEPGADKKAKDEEEKAKAKKEADDKKAKDAAEEEEKKKVADKKAKDAATEEEEKKKAADRKARDEKKSMDRKARDAAPEGLKGWLKGKMNAEDYGKACDMLESERKADDEASAMSSMTEKDPDPENTNSTGGAKDKKAMDEDTVKGLVAAERRNQQAIYEARNAVRPRVGELTLAFDSAEDVYKTALEASGVKTAGVHPSAFKAMFGMLPSRNVETLSDRRLAMDAASSKSFAERFPGAAAIRR